MHIGSGFRIALEPLRALSPLFGIQVTAGSLIHDADRISDPTQLFG